MSGEGIQSNLGAHEEAEAAQADALAASVQTAAVVTAQAVNNAEQTAAHLQAAAAEHAEQVEERVQEHIVETKEALQWQTQMTERLAAFQDQQNLALTEMAERQSKTETVLENLLALLTRQPSQPTAETAVEPESVAGPASPTTKKSGENPSDNPEPPAEKKRKRFIL